MLLPAYAELHCRSNFSFLTAASHPEELVSRAAQLGYAALAITDECSLAGVVRAHGAAKQFGLHLVVGAEMQLTLPAPPSATNAAHAVQGANPAGAAAAVRGPDAAGAAAAASAPHTAGAPHARLVLLAQSRRGYGNLAQWITVARRRAPKGGYAAHPSDVEGRVPNAPYLAGLPGCFALLLPAAAQPFETIFAHAMWLKTWFGTGRCAIAVELLHHAGDDQLVELAQRVAGATGLALVAAGDVRMHLRSRKPLHDALVATRLALPLSQCGFALDPNAEAHLRSRGRLQALYPPEWLARTVEIAGRCSFSLDELRYEYPREIVPEGATPASHLRALTEAGARKRYPGGMPASVRALIEHELALIAQLAYEPYFLTVADIVHWARGEGILCQGRGSAANSAVCYCLGVTEVDPARMNMLFERFVSAERNEPPDIDIDFEHQRREEVIQYIYRKYGRHRAALTAVVISYRPRSALRDIGRALGFDRAAIDAVAKSQHGFGARAIDTERLRENGFDPDAPLVRLWAELARQLIGFPRHLSQHPGGFVIARDQIAQLVPVENAAMTHAGAKGEGPRIGDRPAQAGDDTGAPAATVPGGPLPVLRSVIQWDKDDLDTLGLLKVDILALGMLSAIRRALAFISAKLGRHFAMQDVPPEDAATYEMICRADTVGVFQIESRAQMSMLPRLQPRCFYDLVVEVAIVRPGPIQGGMVHPYLKNRALPADALVYPSAEVRRALERTRGVPIFQEQVMQLAILAADFTPGEADALRRAMAAWKRKGGLGPFHARLTGRMVEKGYAREFAEGVFKQIEGFGEYGFPESHAASFALLAYVSSWIKCHHPDALLAALLNSQPMGFYAPAQLVRDARAHGVPVLPVDVCMSGCEATLEPPPSPPALSPGYGGRSGAFEPHAASPLSGSGMQAGTRAAGEGAETPALHLPLPLGEGWGEGGADGLRVVRLGLNQIAGLGAEAAARIVTARAAAPFAGVEDLARRAALDARELRLLAQAGALQTLAGHRHAAAWAVAGVDTRPPPLLRATRTTESEAAQLAAPGAAEAMLADYRALGLSLGQHPLALLRAELGAFRVEPAAALRGYPNGRLARASGLVTHRQRPETAKGTVFVTLEDETGAVNVIVWPRVAQAQRRALIASTLLTVYGTWQREGEGEHAVMHLVAARLVDHSALLQGLASRSRDFR